MAAWLTSRARRQALKIARCLGSSASALPHLTGWAESAGPATFEKIAALAARAAYDRAIESGSHPPRRATTRRRCRRGTWLA